MNMASKNQIHYMKKHGLSTTGVLTRQHAWAIIQGHKDKTSAKKVVIKEPSTPASSELKRFMKIKKIDFTPDISREEAVNKIEERGYFVNSDDTVILN